MRIVVLSSNTITLFWYRMDMMQDFMRQGHSIIAMGPGTTEEWSEKFSRHQIEFRAIPVEKNGLNPLSDLKTYHTIRKLLSEIQPDCIFTYQAKTIVYGCLAAKSAGINQIYPLVAGLGSVLRGSGLKNNLVKAVMKLEYRFAFKASKRVFFHNKDDLALAVQMDLLSPDKAVVLNGSGVNLDFYQPAPIPVTPAFLLIARIIKDKGIQEYLEAARIIKAKYPDVRFMLIGPFDTNPSAMKLEDLSPYLDDKTVEYFGEQQDVRPFIAQSSTYVLPSYHEGTPKTVLESMAMGRPIITSDAPGCRETVIDGFNGYLVPVKNVLILAEAMERLILDPNLCRRMGEASLKLVHEKYDVHAVNHVIMSTMKLI